MPILCDAMPDYRPSLLLSVWLISQQKTKSRERQTFLSQNTCGSDTDSYLYESRKQMKSRLANV